MVDKLERLMDLLITLLETERLVSADDLRSRVPGYPDKLESFRRAFERDKEELRDLGIPLTMDYVPGTDPPILGYRIHKSDYYLSDPGLDPDELAALHLAASVVELEGAPGDDPLWTLGGIPDPVGHPDAGNVEVVLPGDPNLGSLFGAIHSRSRISFSYGSTDRAVDPYRLDLQHGWWYLTGLDHLRKAERTFRVDRIQGEVVVGQPNSFDHPGKTQGLSSRTIPWEVGEGDPVLATLLVDAHRAGHASVTLGEERVVDRRHDGSLVFEVPVVNWPAFRSFILGFLEHAELLGPPQWRGDLRDWLVALST